jgi:hypothetical protein
MRKRTLTLFRPVGSFELELIKKTGWRRFPPRLPGQPIFYPVLTESYARQIARDWNTKEQDQVGFVTKFEIDLNFISRFAINKVGSRDHLEYWIPSEDLEQFNDHIVGVIEMIGRYKT